MTASRFVKEIALVRPSAQAELSPFLDVLARTHLPNSVLVVATAGEEGELAKLVPWIEGKPARDGAVTAYVCERRVCRLPTTDAAVFAAELVARGAPTPAAPPGAGAEKASATAMPRSAEAGAGSRGGA